MKKIIFMVGILISSLGQASQNDSAPLTVGERAIFLATSEFRNEEQQARILTRRDELLRVHTGDLGMSLRSRMTPVRDQGVRPTSAAFGSLALLENFTGEDYSEQCLVRFGNNVDDGNVSDWLSYIQKNGVYLEADCPYDISQRDRIGDLGNATLRKFTEPFESYPFEQDDPIAYLKSRLAVNSPVAVELFVVGKSQWSNEAFIYIPDAVTIARECGFMGRCLSHTVVVTGMNDTLGLIEFKNSWGPYWGNSGYGYLSYDYFLTFAKGLMVSY